LLALLATELGFLQRVLDTISLTMDQWLLCIAFALGLLLIDEVVKFFMRRSRSN
jgi:Ca2+-transporting ATPase